MNRRDLLAAVAALTASAATAQDISTLASGTGLAPALGGEQIAMLLYPVVMALDFVGPYHFLSMAGATAHLVSNQADLRPVPSDLDLAIQPTTTLRVCPTDLTVQFMPGCTDGGFVGTAGFEIHDLLSGALSGFIADASHLRAVL